MQCRSRTDEIYFHLLCTPWAWFSLYSIIYSFTACLVIFPFFFFVWFFFIFNFDIPIGLFIRFAGWVILLVLLCIKPWEGVRFLFVFFSWNQNSLRTWGDLRTNGRICRSSLYWFCLWTADGSLNLMYLCQLSNSLKEYLFSGSNGFRGWSYERLCEKTTCIKSVSWIMNQEEFWEDSVYHIYIYNNLAREPE